MVLGVMWSRLHLLLRFLLYLLKYPLFLLPLNVFFLHNEYLHLSLHDHVELVPVVAMVKHVLALRDVLVAEFAANLHQVLVLYFLMLLEIGVLFYVGDKLVQVLLVA